MSHEDENEEKVIEGFLESFKKEVGSCEEVTIDKESFSIDNYVDNEDTNLNMSEIKEDTEIDTDISELNDSLVQGIKSDQLKTIEETKEVNEKEEEIEKTLSEDHDDPKEVAEVITEVKKGTDDETNQDIEIQEVQHISDNKEPQDDQEDSGRLSINILTEVIDKILFEKELQLETEDNEGSGEFFPSIELINTSSQRSISGETNLDFVPSPDFVLPIVESTSSPDNHIDPEVLEPDNPLLARFQKALESHLQKQLKRLKEDILNLKGEIKENDKNEETVSQEIYTIEIKLNQQQQRLKKLFEKMKETTSSWDSLTFLIIQLKADYNEKSQNLDAMMKKDSELQTEVESLAALIQQFSEWEQKQSSELFSTKFLSERQEADKKKLFSEKQKLDLLLLSVRKDVLKYMRTFEDMKQHIMNKTKELNIVEQTVADANADIEEMLSNNRKIMNLWAKNIVIISQKDKTLLETQQGAEDHKLKYNTLVAEVEGSKKECNDLIKYNEQLTAKTISEERFYDNLRRRLKEEIEKKRVLEESLAQVIRMKEFTESDLALSQHESDEVAKKINFVMDECAKAKAENNLIEEKIVNKLIEQATENKTAQSLNNSIQEFKNFIREQEVAIADYENRIAKVMVETEKHRMTFECSDLQLKTVDNEIHEKEMKIKSLKNELERTIFTGQQTQSEIDKNVRKLEKLKEAKGECELSPEEIKIRELEKKISDLDEESAEQQQFWIRQENHIVSISQQRTDQLQEISVLRKQLIILDKKNMMIENEINAQEKERRNYLSTKESLQKKLVKFNEQLIKKKGYKEELDNNNKHIQNKYVANLKDSEDATIALQNEINDLDGQKKELYDKISQQQREVLAWEKKLQMAIETRQLMENLHGDGGELANMKNEIHRMEIRYSQLQKAQEKLALDMELSVNRRDGIVDATLAREKHAAKGGMHYTKQQYAKKMEELKQNIRHTATELNSVNKEAYLHEKKKKQLEEQLNLKNDQLLALKKATEQMDVQLAEGHLHRQKNLEKLVRLQRKCRLYHDVKTSQYKLLYRNESGLEVENQRLKTMKSDLTSIIESLINDFPSLLMLLTATRNTLQVSS